MSTTYNGVASNVSPPSALTITNVSAGSTPTVTVSSPLPAAIVSQFTGTITGVEGATGVNGTWTLTKTGASTFTVPTGAPGTFVSAGTPSVQPVLLEGITIPADGDLGSAASVNTPFESLQDQGNYLLTAIGQWKIVTTFGISYFNTVNSSVGSSPSLAGTTWGDWTGGIASVMPFCTQSGNGPLNVEQGDQVMVKVGGTLFYAGTAGTNSFICSVWYANWVPGGTPTYSQAAMVGAGLRSQGSPVVNFSSAFSLAGMVPAPNVMGMPLTGLFDFKIRVDSSASASAGDLLLISGIYAEAILLRPNFNLPQ